MTQFNCHPSISISFLTIEVVAQDEENSAFGYAYHITIINPLTKQKLDSAKVVFRSQTSSNKKSTGGQIALYSPTEPVILDHCSRFVSAYHLAWEPCNMP
uniref:AlNc14C6G848 protein n=1 Tax=Albugo laibachii Nc14 TaxID=890382 RepID=F0W172_9STRA|nr:AlNc14C6G848 [Albugo laibachii Nc14]|eukprot:CCA14797.1 AlNc14C6G848 [Albugo laibachii Nc14]